MPGEQACCVLQAARAARAGQMLDHGCPGLHCLGCTRVQAVHSWTTAWMVTQPRGAGGAVAPSLPVGWLAKLCMPPLLCRCTGMMMSAWVLESGGWAQSSRCGSTAPAPAMLSAPSFGSWLGITGCPLLRPQPRPHPALLLEWCMAPPLLQLSAVGLLRAPVPQDMRGGRIACTLVSHRLAFKCNTPAYSLSHLSSAMIPPIAAGCAGGPECRCVSRPLWRGPALGALYAAVAG